MLGYCRPDTYTINDYSLTDWKVKTSHMSVLHCHVPTKLVFVQSFVELLSYVMCQRVCIVRLHLSQSFLCEEAQMTGIPQRQSFFTTSQGKILA